MNALTGLGAFYLITILIYLIIGVFFGVVISLIFRPYVLWYFKINRKIELQEETNRLLEEIAQDKFVSNEAAKIRDHSAYMPK